MNRKLWSIALLDAWRGFPSAKAVCCANGRNYKGIRREHVSAADGQGQSSTGKCSGAGPCGSSLGWVQGNLGRAELERGEPKPLAVYCSLRADQISLCSSCTRGPWVSVVVTESSGEGESHQLALVLTEPLRSLIQGGFKPLNPRGLR